MGDGCIYIRIRDSKTGLVFIPKFEIVQKNTASSIVLMKKICNFFSDKGIPSSLRIENRKVLCVIEGIENVCYKLLPLLEKQQEFFFWKERILKMTNQLGKLLSLDSRNLLTIKYLILKTIYSIDNNRKNPLEHWINRINEIFKIKLAKNISGEFYITPIKEKKNIIG